MARILISAGHTVMDPGATYQDLREADLTRKIATKVVAKLQEAKADVKAVPLDLPLFQRIEWINETGYTADQGDLLVEIHINDADGTKRGVECWYEGEGKNKSQELAAVVTDQLVTDLGYTDNGVKSELEHELGMLIFLNRTNTASVILETLYLDNEEDGKILRDDTKLNELASSISKGILRYVGKDASGADLESSKKPNITELVAKYCKPIQRPTPKNPVLDMDDDDLFDDMDDDLGFLQNLGAGLGGNNPIPTAAPSANDPLKTTTPSFTPASVSKPTLQDRESRKQMIEKTYQRVLGRAPTQSDLNFFLNKGTSEQELIEKMIDSQEHLDIIKDHKELKDIKTKLESKERELTMTKAMVSDLKNLLDSLNKLVAHKNQAIQNLEHQSFERHGVPTEVHMKQKAGSGQNNTQSSQSSVKLGSTFKERLFSSIAKRLS